MNTINLAKLAKYIQAYQNKTILPEWKAIHEENIEKMCELLPHGSGIDGKCEIQLENCSPNKIVFFVEFHHLNENGYYDGWTEHNIVLTPSFVFGYDMKITGQNKNDIKDYLHQTFSSVFDINTEYSL